jgi:hypothetical protein
VFKQAHAGRNSPNTMVIKRGVSSPSSTAVLNWNFGIGEQLLAAVRRRHPSGGHSPSRREIPE